MDTMIVYPDGERPALQVVLDVDEIRELARALWIANQRLVDIGDEPAFDDAYIMWRDHADLLSNSVHTGENAGQVFPVTATVSRTYDPDSYVEYTREDGDEPTQEGFLRWLDVEADFNGGTYNDPVISIDRGMQ